MNKNGKNFNIVTSLLKMTFKAFISLCFLKIKVMFLVTQHCTVGLNNNGRAVAVKEFPLR